MNSSLSLSDLIQTDPQTAWVFLLGLACIILALYSYFRYHRSHRVLAKQIEAFQEQLKVKSDQVEKVTNELQTTQLKLLETGKISALASLSAGILHQVSQPITAIHGFVKFIKKEMDPKETFYRPICLIEEQSIYLKQMLEDLMELVRHRKIKKENIDVNNTLERAMNLVDDELRIRRINWEMQFEEKPPLVYADGIHLQQIFLNIVSNAIQALGGLPPGAERSLVISTVYHKIDHKIYVSFEDTGPGVNASDKENIFEPFYSTKAKGAGIGLSLCKDLIAEHGGQLSVESEPGQGAKFTIKLPCVQKGA